MLRRLAIWGGLLLCILGLGISSTTGFDPSRYEPRLLRDITGEHPAKTGLSLTRDIPVRSKVIYSGEFRALAEESRRLIRAWSKAMNVPETEDAFKREVKVREAGRDYWVPVQEILVQVMTGELHSGEEIQLFVIYIGQVEGRHLFLVNAFDHIDARHPPR